MPLRRLPASAALLALTFVVWTTRINKIVTDDALGGGEVAARLALSLSFTLLVAAGVWAFARDLARLRPVITVLAFWTVGVWAVRAVGIGLADHDAGFIAVHLVLAVVSAVAAGLALREVRTRLPAGRPAGPQPTPHP